MEIGITELQKKISLFRHLEETVRIVDRKSKETLALVLPSKESRKDGIVEELGGIFRNYRPRKKYQDVEAMVREAFDEEMREKYDH